jgi:translation initiation factor 1 (eIF-1/SUI1)
VCFSLAFKIAFECLVSRCLCDCSIQVIQLQGDQRKNVSTFLVQVISFLVRADEFNNQFFSFGLSPNTDI